MESAKEIRESDGIDITSTWTHCRIHKYIQFSLVTRLSKLLAGVARAPLAGQRQLTQQSIFDVVPKMDTGAPKHRIHHAVE